MSRIVGIDLGTTNSLVAYVDGGIPKVIPDAEGRALLPSIVGFTAAGVIVGEAARRQLARNAARTVYSVKRLMGRGYEDIFRSRWCRAPRSSGSRSGIARSLHPKCLRTCCAP